MCRQLTVGFSFLIGWEAGRTFSQLQSVVERFSVECRKTKTKVITLTNSKRHKQHNGANQNWKQIHAASVKRGKMRGSKSPKVLLLHLIG